MTSDSGRTGRSGSDYAMLRQFLANLMRQDPFTRYGAHALGIGRKVVAGAPTEQLAVRFYVAAKVPPAQLPPERRIPGSFHFIPPGEEQGVNVPTDVIESAPARVHIDLESEVRPVPGGVSVSSAAASGGGTFGGWVWDNTDDTIVMLSNQHVFGDTAGALIIQPGTPDGGVFPNDRVGQMKRSVPIVPLGNQRPTPDLCNLVDAAVGDADSSELFDLTVAEIGPAVYDIGDAAIGLQVEKTGQTTGHTVGVVTDVDYNTVVTGYPEGDAVFCDCFRIEPLDQSELWGSNGDSGSIVFMRTDETAFQPALGLHFAGGALPPNNWGLACKIGNVFSILDLGRLCDGGFAAFLDAVFPDDESEADGSPVSFTTRERHRRRSRRLHSGLARDVQRRLMTTRRGRLLTDTVARHRAELLALLVLDGDVRRGTVAALRPILKGSTTTTSVLAHRLTDGDLHRLEDLATEVARKGSEDLRSAVDSLRALGQGARGRSVGEIVDVAV